MRKASFAVLALLLAPLLGASAAGTSEEPRPTTKELKVEAALSVARLEGLTREQAILLLAIHDHEDGEAACKEFGIENQPVIVKDPVERYFRWACKSARAVKLWCPDARPATVRRFNHGFGKGRRRYPGYAEDPDWWRGVLEHMRSYRKILY